MKNIIMETFLVVFGLELSTKLTVFDMKYVEK